MFTWQIITIHGHLNTCSGLCYISRIFFYFQSIGNLNGGNITNLQGNNVYNYIRVHLPLIWISFTIFTFIQKLNICNGWSRNVWVTGPHQNQYRWTRNSPAQQRQDMRQSHAWSPEGPLDRTWCYCWWEPYWTSW